MLRSAVFCDSPFRSSVLLLIVVLGLAGGRPAQAQIHVTETGDPAADGTTWGNATTLRHALDVATGSDEIWVAGGTYTPVTPADPNTVTTAEREASFRITGAQDGLKLHGGFAGTEATLADRDLSAGHETILSGDIGRDDGPFAPTTDSDDAPDTLPRIDHLAGGNSYTVLYVDGTGSSGPSGGAVTRATVISGVTVTGGQADDGMTPKGSSGGGLYCDGSDPGGECSPTLVNVTFAANTAGNGGAVYNDGEEGTATPAFTNVVWIHNTARGSGGAVSNWAIRETGTASPVFANVTMTDNRAMGDGGAIFNFAQSLGRAAPTIENAILWGNRAVGDGNEIRNEGDSFSLSDHTLTIQNTLLAGGEAAVSAEDFFSSGPGSVDGTNIIDADPRLVNGRVADGPDDRWGTADDGLRLRAGSPALDAGANVAVPDDVADLDGDGTVAEPTPLDRAGAARVQSDGASAVDLGAYEGGVPDPERTLYVDADATGGAQTGTTWGDAYTDLQDALAAATGNDEIWIAEGTYTPVTPADPASVAPIERSVSFRVTGGQDGLGIYGGFAGGETRRAQRAPNTNVVTLSGNIGDPTDENDNSFRVLYFDGTTGAALTTDTVLDGITVAGGTVRVGATYAFLGFEVVDARGAGLYCNGRGGVCSPTLTRVTFTDNFAEGDGGALYNDGGEGAGNSPGESSPVITRATFSGNRAGEGGALYNNGVGGTSSPQITNTTFVGNRATAFRGGAIYSNGGNGTSSPTLTNATITGNEAGSDGGGVFMSGVTSTLTLTNTILWSNAASGEGDELYNENATLAVRHSLVEGRAPSGPGTLDGTSADRAPLFVDGDVSDGTYDLRLQAGSPALSRGTYAPFEAGGIAGGATADRAGSPRRFGLFPDLGAYERTTVEATSRNVSGAGGLLGYLDPDGFGGTVLLRENGAAAGTLTFERTSAAPSGTGLPAGVAPYTWGVTSSLSAAPTYDLMLETADVPGVEDFSALMMYRSTDGGQTWAAVDAAGTVVRQAGRGLLAVEGLTGVGQFAIGSARDPLPVELAGFEVRPRGETVALRWQTASETNNAGFRVERRGEEGTGGHGDWVEVGSVDGAGTTTEARSYAFTDEGVPYDADSLTYRLKQVDVDGSVNYSEARTVVRSGVDEVRLLGTYPNPARSRATVRLAIPEMSDPGSRPGQRVTLRLYDVLGRQVRTVWAGAAAGRHELQLDTGGLASGTYFLRLTAGGTTRTQQVTVVR